MPESAGPAVPAGPRPPSAGPSRYYPLFDFLRIILAMGVFASHGGGHFLSTHFPNLGNFCVQVFFALSGFLIGGILRESTLESLPRFYFNRSTRIWIPYFLGILLLAGGCLAKHQPWTGKLAEFFFDKVTFTYDLFGPPQLAACREAMPLQGTGNHFWSICVEEQFYLFAPLLIVGLKRFAALGILAAGTLASLKYPGYFASITVGVLLALSEGRWGTWYRRRGVQGLGLAILAVTAWGLEVHPELYPALSPVQSVILVSLAAKQGPPAWAGPFLGGISYPFYLNHWVGLVFVKPLMRFVGSHGVAIAAALVIALGYSSVHYLMVDRTIHRRRSGWFTRRNGLITASVGFLLVGLGLVVNAIWLRSR